MVWNETSDAIVELNQKGCLQPRVRNVGDMNLLSFEGWLPTTIGKDTGSVASKRPIMGIDSSAGNACRDVLGQTAMTPQARNGKMGC